MQKRRKRQGKGMEGEYERGRRERLRGREGDRVRGKEGMLQKLGADEKS